MWRISYGEDEYGEYGEYWVITNGGQAFFCYFSEASARWLSDILNSVEQSET